MGVDAPSQTPEVVDGETLRRRKRSNRIPLLMVLAITLIGVGGVMYDAFAPTTEEPLDAQSHAAVVRACDNAYHTLKALPPLTHNSTRAQLEARVAEENNIYEAMVKRFAPLQPPNHDGRVALRAWTADWISVLTRRQSYVLELRATTKHVDLIIPVDPKQAPVTDRMNQYSRTHGLQPCLTDTLQLETVDTIRQYPKTDTVGG